MNKSTAIRAAAAIAAAAFLIACGTGAPGSAPSASPSSAPSFTATLDSPAPEVSTSPSPAKAAPTIRVAATFTDGIWQVPEDVKPGTYKTKVPADSWNCYYEVMRDFSGNINSIISNGNQDADKQVVITIPKTAKGVEAEGCGTWTKIK